MLIGGVFNTDLDVANPISNLITALLSIMGCRDVIACWSMPTTDARISMNLKVLRVLLITSSDMQWCLCVRS